MQKLKKHTALSVAVIIAMLCFIAVMIIHLYPLVNEIIANVDDETKVVNYIQSNGLKGVPILLGLQALQIIVAFIPAAAIHVLVGLCYGVWWGTLISIAGITLGNVIVFIMIRQLKNLFAPFFVKNTKHKGRLNPETIARVKRPAMIAFFFFLIPFFPNGIVPYVFAQTKISLPKYLLAVTAGVVPSVVMCTFLGQRLSEGSYYVAIIVAVIFLLIAAAALLFKGRIIAKITAESPESAKT